GQGSMTAAPLVSRAVSRWSTRSPTAVPPRVGSTSAGAASGRLSTAAAPTRPTRPKRTSPRTCRRAASTPSSAQPTLRTTAIPTSRATLSAVPNRVIARSLSQDGVRSTNCSPTASTGEGVPSVPTTPVRGNTSSSAVPTVTAPAATPARAAGAVRRSGVLTPHPAPPGRWSEPGATVDRLADEVGVAVVLGVLLDQVHEDPAQADPVPAPGRPGCQRVQPLGPGQRLLEDPLGLGDRPVVQGEQLLLGVVGRAVPVPVPVGLPVGGVERAHQRPVEEDLGEPLGLHQGQVLEHPAQRHRRGRQPAAQLLAGEVVALLPQHRAVVV